MTEDLALELAGTIRHDGHGGVADDLTVADGLTGWVRDRADRLGSWAADFTADEETHTRVLALRAAVRALFARAVLPGPPSPADAHRLLPFDEALRRVNAAAASVTVTLELEWRPDGAGPTARTTPAPVPAHDGLPAALARATVDFLAGPHRANLRACTAPRCVRYFVQGHGRQQFCKTSCGNRARAARHYERHQNERPR
ncbi:CGNR zinc finger domain-containing protein [Virgisporangium aurantiacum]|uniref:Zinc finger CGNR domain-containing protein n=1 Tax=Virgisporangium aurantiacum TaxID=175570 RepID=A0A8J3YZ19_9ACTN|nr:ABATE domain-containing protein [Virgisporangium aurantiacum]GIJ53312.1 hypothetical protein Vau01_008280 [Virgisporangium aurantiacum]